jgi:LytS/YehU family sensor histidine kinase
MNIEITRKGRLVKTQEGQEIVGFYLVDERLELQYPKCVLSMSPVERIGHDFGEDYLLVRFKEGATPEMRVDK